MAINRDAIRDRVMEGLSETTENLIVPGSPGYVSSMVPPKYDPDAAKKLLAEAGFPNGFGLTVHGPNNRLVNDEKIAQTVAQMFTRIGVDTKVETMPMAVYAPRGAKYEFSVALIAWGGSVDLTSPMRALLACENPAKGMGVVNWAKYCNPKVDELLMKADSMDPLVRSRILREAAGIISKDVALIPLHFQVSAWAVKKGLTYKGRGDERTYAFDFKPM
jgi:peptide/nickel transport system substrate-binding protein